MNEFRFDNSREFKWDKPKKEIELNDETHIAQNPAKIIDTIDSEQMPEESNDKEKYKILDAKFNDYKLSAFEVQQHQNGKYNIVKLKNLTDLSIVVPDCVESIGEEAFMNSDLIEIFLPEGLLKIGNRAFANCKQLDKIKFPKTLRIIGDEAFCGCEFLETVIPENVRIGKDAFKYTVNYKAEKARLAEQQQEELKADSARQKAQSLDQQIAELSHVDLKDANWAKSVFALKDELEICGVDSRIDKKADNAFLKKHKIFISEYDLFFTILKEAEHISEEEKIESEKAYSLTQLAKALDQRILTMDSLPRNIEWAKKMCELAEEIENNKIDARITPNADTAFLEKHSIRLSQYSLFNSLKLAAARIIEQTREVEIAIEKQRQKALDEEIARKKQAEAEVQMAESLLAAAGELDKKIRDICSSAKNDDSWVNQVLELEKELQNCRLDARLDKSSNSAFLEKHNIGISEYDRFISAKSKVEQILAEKKEKDKAEKLMQLANQFDVEISNLNSSQDKDIMWAKKIEDLDSRMRYQYIDDRLPRYIHVSSNIPILNKYRIRLNNYDTFVSMMEEAQRIKRNDADLKKEQRKKREEETQQHLRDYAAELDEKICELSELDRNSTWIEQFFELEEELKNSRVCKALDKKSNESLLKKYGIALTKLDLFFDMEKENSCLLHAKVIDDKIVALKNTETKDDEWCAKLTELNQEIEFWIKAYGFSTELLKNKAILEQINTILKQKNNSIKQKKKLLAITRLSLCIIHTLLVILSITFAIFNIQSLATVFSFAGLAVLAAYVIFVMAIAFDEVGFILFQHGLPSIASLISAFGVGNARFIPVAALFILVFLPRLFILLAKLTNTHNSQNK